MIYTALTDANIPGVTGVDAVVMPQQCDYPRIRYQRVGVETIQQHDSGDVCDVPSFQIDVYGHNYKQVREIAVAVRATMAAATDFTARFITESGDDYEPEHRLFRVSQDFRVWSD